VVKCGVEASCTHGVCVTGATNQELDSLRSIAFDATEPRAGGKSKTMGFALTGGCDFDPIHRCAGPWQRMTLKRLDWEMEGLGCWTTPADHEYCPLQYAPWTTRTRKLVAQSVERWQSSKVLEQAGLPQGVLPLRQLRRWTSVGKGSAADAKRWPPLTDEEKGYVRSVLVDGQWLNERRHAARPCLARSPLCSRCGAAPGTPRHQHVECSDGWGGLDLPAAMAGLKAHGDSDAVRALAGRLLLAEPRHHWAPSCGDVLCDVRWLVGGGDPFLGGEVFVDGSAFDAEAADLAAAGCAVIALALPPGPEWAGLQGLIQDVDGGKLLSCWRCGARCRYWRSTGDSANVVKGLYERGPARVAELRAPPALRARWGRHRLALDGVVFWVAGAGCAAARSRRDVQEGVRLEVPPRVILTVTQHDVAQRAGQVSYLRCCRSSSLDSAAAFWSSHCNARPGASVRGGAAPPEGRASSAAAALALAAAAAAAGGDLELFDVFGVGEAAVDDRGRAI
ncbi:unnamed protein product, partial [Prorocentrum cordatum]